MLNFLFGVLCAGGILFGGFLTYTGVIDQTYEAVTAGGVFLFGSLLTFGVAQLTRKKSVRHRRVEVPVPTLHRVEEPKRAEPAIFPEGGEPVPHPVLERVASRFARAGH